MSDAPTQFSSRRERRIFELEHAARLEAESRASAGVTELASPTYIPPVPSFEPVPSPATPAAVVAEPADMFGASEPADVFGAPAPVQSIDLSPVGQPTIDDDAADAFFSQAAAASAPLPSAAAPEPSEWQPTADLAAVSAPASPVDSIPMVAGGAPKRPEPKPPAAPETKGVNLWAAIAITATLSSAVLTYLPPTAFIAPYIAFIAVPLAIVAIFLRGFKKIQSIVALVLAIGFGGYNAYTMFLVPAEDEGASEVLPPPSLLTISADGGDAANVAWLLEESGEVISESNDPTSLPFSLAVPVSDVDMVTLTVTVTPTDGTPASCAVALGDTVLAEQTSTADGGPAICTYIGAGVEDEPVPGEEPAESPAPAEPTPAP